MAAAGPPPAPRADIVQRHRAVVVAGHTNDSSTVHSYLKDEDPNVRQASLAALHRLGECTAAHIVEAFADASPRVRARAAELSVAIDGVTPAALLNDRDASVVEVTCFSCGELEWPPGTAPIDQLAAIATQHDDPLCRESAAAALGAIGDPAGLDAVLAACTDRVTVRRRATLALAAFDDERAEAALHAALTDKDWQVRQAAEDLLEVGRVLDAPPDPDAYAE